MDADLKAYLDTLRRELAEQQTRSFDQLRRESDERSERLERRIDSVDTGLRSVIEDQVMPEVRRVAEYALGLREQMSHGFAEQERTFDARARQTEAIVGGLVRRVRPLEERVLALEERVTALEEQSL